MTAVTFNIPARLARDFSGRKFIARADDPAEFVQHILPYDLNEIAFVQLTNLDCETDSLIHWGEGIAVDIVLDKPAERFSSLYNFSALQHKHPVRVTIRVEPGFRKAVKLALSLKFAVKLDIGQPDPDLVRELEEVLDLYLHQSTINEPVEFFHSVFLSFYKNEPASLWNIHEEDPDEYCFVTDEGNQLPSRRIASSTESGERRIQANATVARGNEEQCNSCEFFDRCRGYFKLPDPGYDCVGVKKLFSTLRDEAEKLRKDIESFDLSKENAHV